MEDFAAACAQVNPTEAARCAADPAFAKAASATFPFAGGDRVFPDFITKHMPTGLSGLVVAAIFAAALSSSLNSIAATAVNDLYKPFARGRSDKHYLRVSQWLTLVWGVVQIGVAVVALLSLLIAVVFRRQVLRAGEGTEAMQVIARSIQELARDRRTIAFCVTVIGIPFGIASFKLAAVGLFPLGKRVVETVPPRVSSIGVPEAIRRPRSMMWIRSASRSASSM